MIRKLDMMLLPALYGDGLTKDSIDTLVDLVESHQNWNDEADPHPTSQNF